jgi:transketolase C-terminal domain/subunit
VARNISVSCSVTGLALGGFKFWVLVLGCYFKSKSWHVLYTNVLENMVRVKTYTQAQRSLRGAFHCTEILLQELSGLS